MRIITLSVLSILLLSGCSKSETSSTTGNAQPSTQAQAPSTKSINYTCEDTKECSSNVALLVKDNFHCPITLINDSEAVFANDCLTNIDNEKICEDSKIKLLNGKSTTCTKAETVYSNSEKSNLTLLTLEKSQDIESLTLKNPDKNNLVVKSYYIEKTQGNYKQKSVLCDITYHSFTYLNSVSNRSELITVKDCFKQSSSPVFQGNDLVAITNNNKKNTNVTMATNVGCISSQHCKTTNDPSFYNGFKFIKFLERVEHLSFITTALKFKKNKDEGNYFSNRLQLIKEENNIHLRERIKCAKSMPLYLNLRDYHYTIRFNKHEEPIRILRFHEGFIVYTNKLISKVSDIPMFAIRMDKYETKMKWSEENKLLIDTTLKGYNSETLFTGLGRFYTHEISIGNRPTIFDTVTIKPCL